jgi:hypothetical protein
MLISLDINAPLQRRPVVATVEWTTLDRLAIYFAVAGCLTRMVIFSDTMGGSNG